MSAKWYVKKGIRVTGPYSVSDIAKYMLFGRVRATDEVSNDLVLWEPLSQVPELIPEELTENIDYMASDV